MTAPPSGPSRNDVSPATSSARTSRPSGGITGGVPLRPGSLSMGVSVGPGATTFTVTALGASSAAQDRASAGSAALVAAYWLLPGTPVIVRLPTSTTRPPSATRSTSVSTRTPAACTWIRHMRDPSSGSSSPSRAER
ncbi:hypothetical protein SVIO_092750 [Streptomyces violaceusniger]|uniref:Uncharacterized protein n=1 Tax=Streptomyces violaceusniger TaxID=68280 RepID=A0A4D4LBM8_STRVO|nr:hypothetical protein SVIO_092750 [Streptomyces violaceusniger]